MSSERNQFFQELWQGSRAVRWPEHATGAYVSLIDADLQQRPELVRQMVEILDTHPEYDIVAAYQDKRGDGKVLSFFKEGFYSLINRLSTVKLRPDASDFRTFRRKVAESILSLPEYHRFSKGIFAWVGYETCFIPYTACERAAGTTKWSFKKLFRYAMWHHRLLHGSPRAAHLRVFWLPLPLSSIF